MVNYMESWILSAEPVSPAPVCRIASPNFDEHTCAHTHARTQIHLRLRETRAAGRPSLSGVDHGKRQTAKRWYVLDGGTLNKMFYSHGDRTQKRFPCELLRFGLAARRWWAVPDMKSDTDDNRAIDGTTQHVYHFPRPPLPSLRPPPSSSVHLQCAIVQY